MELIKAEFMNHMKHNQDEGGKANGKTGNINDRIGFLSGKIPKGDEQVIFEHLDNFNLSDG
jgi:hypothetical protein